MHPVRNRPPRETAAVAFGLAISQRDGLWFFPAIVVIAAARSPAATTHGLPQRRPALPCPPERRGHMRVVRLHASRLASRQRFLRPPRDRLPLSMGDPGPKANEQVLNVAAHLKEVYTDVFFRLGEAK